MHSRTPAAVLALAASAAAGSVTLIQPLDGYWLGGFHSLSADGAVLAVDLFAPTDASYETFHWSASGWSLLPGAGAYNNFRGLSADGSAALVESTIPGHALVHHRGGVATQIIASPTVQTAAGLTRDGNTVIGVTRNDPDAPQSIFRWTDGVMTALGAVDGRYTRVGGIVVGEHDDFFVFNSDIQADPYGSGGPARAVVYNQGSFTEVATLSDAAYISSVATDMTADGSTIIGTESAWNTVDPGDGDDTTRSWMLANGVFSEIAVQGVHDLHVRSITDDASVMVAHGVFDGAGAHSFLLHADGRVQLIEDILADHGLILAAGQIAHAESISADGTVIAGVIGHPDGSAVHSLFTVTIPAPAAWPLLGGLLLARRRR